jgi:hypothetical protein
MNDSIRRPGHRAFFVRQFGVEELHFVVSTSVLALYDASGPLSLG